jgi:hypothetical protein
MPQSHASFDQDREAVIQKFGRLIKEAESLANLARGSGDAPNCVGTDDIKRFFEVRTSALNLLARVAGTRSTYYRTIRDEQGPMRLQFTPGIMLGVLSAAMTDYREGFMADAKLLASAEVFADFLVQAEVLLEHDYKDAAAVIIRAVLEDGLRRVCLSKSIVVKDRDGVHQLAEGLFKAHALTAVQFKEIESKKEIGNSAAHGKFDAYTKADVVAFHEFVQRLLATLI